ncbi:hypothetical protein HYFRA_00005463 [Hymenoscyphus fraxineus]|uniref:MYND-type domain-containing protein n=1 Tax=Hymenoscyphus fraxineus TaxID=746836 RepID=A0A9N9KRH4_9HELO|nr:hypothetical protein HYFRA_00005463 [Hymenoscyphus fraxineus]
MSLQGTHVLVPEYDPEKHYCASCNTAIPSQNSPRNCCKMIYYCSGSCKEADKKYHDILCEGIKGWTEVNPRPEDTYYLVLKFPISNPYPKIQWWSRVYKPEFQENDDILPGIPTLESAQPVGHWLRSRFPLAKKYMLDHELLVVFRPKFLSDGSSKNNAIEEFFKFQPSHDWRGDIYVIRVAGDKRGSQLATLDKAYSQDFRAADMRILADFFEYYGTVVMKSGVFLSRSPVFRIGPETRQAGTVDDAFEMYEGDSNAVEGVNITCLGDQEHLKKAAFVKQRVCSARHPIFRHTVPTAVSVHMGLPLLVRKHGFFGQGWPSAVPGPYVNQPAVFLNRAANPSNDDFGWADMAEWDVIVGTVLVVRQDKKPITPQQVEAFCLFCCEYWGDHIEETYARTKRARETFLKNRICREKFEEFFEQLKQKKIKEGDSAWADAVSPYDV